MTWLVFFSFWGLAGAALFREDGFERLRRKDGAAWALDLSGLLVQGVAVPALEATGLFFLLKTILPGYAGSLHAGPVAAFLLNFVGIDYLYYWNHRFLHDKLWYWHAVHHTAEELDVWVTSRNTLWTPLLIVYVWMNALFLFLLADPRPFLWAAALTAVLDLWRHSELWPEKPGIGFSVLGKVLITPIDHAWHHSTDRIDVNFGANLKLWDHWHGTYYAEVSGPSALGVDLEGSLPRKLLYPVGLEVS